MQHVGLHVFIWIIVIARRRLTFQFFVLSFYMMIGGRAML
jgi:hypothetical protein